MPLLHRQPVARVFAALAGAYLIYYLWWRATSTLDWGSIPALALGLLLLAAELQGVATGALFAFMTWDTRPRAAGRPRPGQLVDVYVPTYNEDLDILEATLVGCGAIAYPHTTYVLDDGRRPEVAALAARLGCRYLTRPDNQHAKAGNLNAALPRTDGDFIVVLDADTVPQPDFLDRTLGYFADERVALVQLPQEFYNADSVQHVAAGEDARAWHEQALFYRVIQPGKNRWNAAFWCGSPSVVRRAALQAVGGVATETVTEDIHTSIRLHARGWKTVYHDEALAFGIAPQTLHAFAVQRLRWAQGTMQLLRSRENPLLMPGLTLAQRLNYLASMVTYFDAYQKLIYLLAPALILATGIMPVHAGGWEFLARWSIGFLLAMLANAALGRGHFRLLETEQYNVLKLFTFVWASTVLVWPRRLRFQVTPKQVDRAVYAQERRQLRPHLAVLTLTGGAILLAATNLIWQVTAAYARPDLILVTILWALSGVGLVLLSVAGVLRRRYDRHEYRFPVQLAAHVVLDAPAAPAASASVAAMVEPQVVEMAEVAGAAVSAGPPPAELGARALERVPLAQMQAPTPERPAAVWASADDLSAGGARLLTRGEPAAVAAAAGAATGDQVAVTFELPDGPLTVRGQVTRTSLVDPDQRRLGVRFDSLDGTARQRLVAFLFVTVPRAKHEHDQRRGDQQVTAALIPGRVPVPNLAA